MSIITLRDAVVLADTLVKLSAAYAIWLMLAPRVARWLLIEFIAVSKVAIALAATATVVIEAELIPKLDVLIDDITTEMVWPLVAPLW